MTPTIRLPLFALVVGAVVAAATAMAIVDVTYDRWAAHATATAVHRYREGKRELPVLGQSPSTPPVTDVPTRPADQRPSKDKEKE